MKIYRSLRDIRKPLGESVVSVGIFDGVHRGHIDIVRRLVKRARETKRESVILTFHPHPFLILYPKKEIPLLVSLDHRLRLLGALGVDILLVLKFDRAFSKITPEDFIKRILIKRLGMKEILVGENFIFGKNGKGGTRFLKTLSEKHHFKIEKIALLKIDKKVVSSTYIRSLILNGRLAEAARFLGRPISILGTVRRGRERGRILGFPTANIDPHHEAIPPSGVYAVYVKLDDKRYKGVLNIGVRPTFHPLHYAPEPTIEVHILDIKRDIYSRQIEVLFVKRLRPERKFKTKEALIRRITADEEAAREILREG